MNIRSTILNEVYIVDKPHGFSTHAVSPQRMGIKEFLEQQLGSKLYICHRLDKTTSGILLLPATAQKCKELTEDFEQRKIHKRYLMLTDTKSETREISISTPIENKPAETVFKKLKENPKFSLWEAFPKTGRTHQIRIHAREAGIPILGDDVYGGSPFPRIALHASELILANGEKISCPNPIYFERVHTLLDPTLRNWLIAIDYRMRLFGFDECVRLIHREDEKMRLDLLGDVLWFYDYSESGPDKKTQERVSYISRTFKKAAVIRTMQNRGENPNQSELLWIRGEKIQKWVGSENGIQYEFRSDQGLSPGLFLDQRENRKKVLENSKEKSVLNLFSYTCGFSVCAALGGAKEVVSVDLSQRFLDWGKENFRLNSMDPEKFEFFKADASTFLDGAIKRNRKFDLIILDPPTFSRSKEKIFRFEKDISELLQKCYSLLSESGEILLSTNYEKWDRSKLIKEIKNILPKAKITAAPGPFDFDPPDTWFEGQEPLTKHIWILN